MIAGVLAAGASGGVLKSISPLASSAKVFCRAFSQKSAYLLFCSTFESQMIISLKSLYVTAMLLSAVYPAAAQNLISNPGFEKGNTGFTSNYNFVPPDADPGAVSAGPGSYYLGNNPHVYDYHWSSNITPHTGEAMLIFDGAYEPNMQAWISEPITVDQHRNYDFSAFAVALFPDNPAGLVFRINGQQIGPVFTPTQPPGQWTQFAYVWNSGASTAVIISISDQTTTGIGNDFALDDISLVEQPWFYYVENSAASAWNDATGWISPESIFGFGLTILGVGLAILSVGLAALGIELASLLSGED